MRKSALAVTVAATLAGLAAPAGAQELRAGVGVVDAAWHVGASAGQYASTRNESEELDPHLHQFKNAPSYGVQSRPQMRAIVVEGAPNPHAPGGRNRFALVKTDLYIPQDLLYRRAAQLIPEVAGKDIGIDRTNLTMSATHDHSSPFYTSTAWGAWTFQDVFDVRAYEYYARKIAEAVVEAAERMKPVRVGASTVYLDDVHRNSMGPRLADDGTPAGYPWSYTDHELHVVRFDDISNPRKPESLATIVNYSNHPEGLDGNDLISADWVGAMERMIDRETGGTTIYTQNAVGHSEMERSSHHAPSERLEFYHREYAQSEHAARITADAALDAWKDIEKNRPDAAYKDRFVPFFDEGVVDFHDAWFPGPLTHPYPAVSSCRTDQIAANPPNPRLPVVGLPDCTGPSEAFDELPFSELPLVGETPGLVYQTLKEAGVPIPDNYGAPSFTGLEEDVSVHLQGFRIGDIFFPVCSCEQWADQSFNTKARTDKVAGNETEGHNLGYDWSERCVAKGENWSCPDPRNTSASITIPDLEYRRMHAQVNNDAHGWNSTEWAPYAESEPGDPELIKGNFTHDDNATSAALGYTLTVPISMANDYNGYIVSYREFQEGDHYRKALAGWGPHSSDYMGTRLVKLGRLMKGGPALDETIRDAEGKDVGRQGVLDPDADNIALQLKTDADVLHNDARARAIGTAAQAAIAAYEAQLPNDGGKAEIIEQPKSVERFDLAAVQWNGGSNYTDQPTVTVQRRHGKDWVPENGNGEVVTTLKFPSSPDELPAYRTGGHRWIWTAHWETFVARFDVGGNRVATKPGDYRFVIEGHRREGGEVVPYRLTSDDFRVEPWSGITVTDVRLEDDRRVSFRVGPRRFNVPHADLGGNNPQPLPVELGPIDYPDSYDHPLRARFINPTRNADPTRTELYCFECSFRPWLDMGDADSAEVTFAGADGSRRVRATEEAGRWITDEPLAEGEAAYVCPGDLRDAYDNFNGQLSAAVGAATVRVVCAEALGLPRRAGRTMTVKLQAPGRVRSAQVRVHGRRAQQGRRVTLRRLPRRFKVTVRARTARRTYIATRGYRRQ